MNGIAIASALLLIIGVGLIYYASRSELEKLRAGNAGRDLDAERVLVIVGVACLFMAGVFAFAASARADDARPEKPLAPSERAMLEYQIHAFERIVAICAQGCVVQVANDGQTLAFLRLEAWKRLNPQPQCSPMKRTEYRLQLESDADEIDRAFRLELAR